MPDNAMATSLPALLVHLGTAALAAVASIYGNWVLYRAQGKRLRTAADEQRAASDNIQVLVNGHLTAALVDGAAAKAEAAALRQEVAALKAQLSGERGTE